MKAGLPGPLSPCPAPGRHRAGQGHHSCAHPRADGHPLRVPQARVLRICPSSFPGPLFLISGFSAHSGLTDALCTFHLHFTFSSDRPAGSHLPAQKTTPVRLSVTEKATRMAGPRGPGEGRRVRGGGTQSGPPLSALLAKCPQADTHSRRPAGGGTDCPGHPSAGGQDSGPVCEPTQVEAHCP